MISFLRALLLLVALAGGAWAATPVISNPTATPGANGTATLSITVTPNGADTTVGSSRVDLQACKLEYSIVSPK